MTGWISLPQRKVKWLIALCLGAGLCACAKAPEADGRLVIELWKHQAGDTEEAASYALIERFNAAQQDIRIDAQSIPQASYSDAITVSALANDMPCLLTVDHPKVASFAWAEFIQPLESYVSPASITGLKGSATGVFQGDIYSVGQFDAALALFTRRSILEKIDARIPTLDAPWSREEFMTVLRDLKAIGDYRYPLDIGARETNPDWWAYAMSPWLQSFGGGLINRDTYTSAEGVLNGAEAIAFADWFHALFEEDLVNTREPDDRGFHKGRNAINYTGNWWANAYTELYGDDLLILPPPDFGNGTVIGGGSWQWAISSDCETPEAAARFIDFLMQPDEIAAMASAAGMVPVSEEAAALTETYREGGRNRIFFELMDRYAYPRPASPAFVTIANTFTRAMRDVMDGKDPQDALDDAVDDIDRRIDENDGYRVQGEGGDS